MRDFIEDFTFIAAAESGYSRRTLALTMLLLQQEPPCIDIALDHIRGVLPRLERIGDTARTLSSVAERIARRQGEGGEAA